MKLYEYQKEGIRFIQRSKGRCLIGDEMGLGKSVQALYWTKKQPKLRPVFIICPAFLKENWANEIKKWYPSATYHIINGKKYYSLPKAEYYIINYDLLSSWKAVMKKIIRVAILDECQKIKNLKAVRTRACIEICKDIRYVIALSGTPIVNAPYEFYPTLLIIDPKTYYDWWSFVSTYCDAKRGRWGWDFTGASNVKKLHEDINNRIMIRRLMHEIDVQLPQKSRIINPIRLQSTSTYEALHKQYIQLVKKELIMKAFTVQGKMRREIIQQKMKGVVEWIENTLEQVEKLVVFGYHVKHIETLIQRFKSDAVSLYGKTPKRDKQKAIDAFQNDKKKRLFIGSVKACEGFTLTASHTIGIYEMPWTPGDLWQAEHRCVRIGQKKHVNIFYLLGFNTFEERIYNIIVNKSSILNDALDGGEKQTQESLNELIRKGTMK